MAVTSVEKINGQKVGSRFYIPPLFKVNLDGGRDPFFIVQKIVFPYIAPNLNNILGTWNGSSYHVYGVNSRKNTRLDYTSTVHYGREYPYWATNYSASAGASSTAHGAPHGISINGVGCGWSGDFCTDSSLWFLLDPDTTNTVSLYSYVYGTGSSWWASMNQYWTGCRRIIQLNDIENVIYKI